MCSSRYFLRTADNSKCSQVSSAGFESSRSPNRPASALMRVVSTMTLDLSISQYVLCRAHATLPLARL
ncbi:unnamed protein product [Peniophora sp. CBMAI 1063]|nr:unnamed protein product [Peniophora sp. CBMAI 1063]